MKRLSMLSVLLLLFGCNGTEPPPPPEGCELDPATCESGKVDPDTCQCVPPEEPPPPEGCELDPSTCESGKVDLDSCECVPIEPPDPNLPKPSDYVNMDRVDDIIEGTSSQNPGLLHGLPYGGWRDPLNVAANCPNEVEYIGFSTPNELVAFGEFGLELTREGEDFIVPQLRKVNRRCDPANPQHDPAFCGRSEMRKSRLEEYRGTEEAPRLDAHLKRASDARVLANRCLQTLRANGGFAYDSIAGWCQSFIQAKNQTGFKIESCPQ